MNKCAYVLISHVHRLHCGLDHAGTVYIVTKHNFDV